MRTGQTLNFREVDSGVPLVIDNSVSCHIAYVMDDAVVTRYVQLHRSRSRRYALDAHTIYGNVN